MKKSEISLHHPTNMKSKLKLGTVIQRCFLGVVILIIVNAVLALWAVSSLKSNAALVEHTHAVRLDMEQLEGGCSEMQYGVCGYGFTGKNIFLDSYSRGQQAIQEELMSLKELLQSSPAQLQRLKEMEE